MGMRLRRIIDWIKSNKLICFLSFAAIIVVWVSLSFYCILEANAESIRIIILLIGGLMAFYGLVQATARQNTFSKQVDTQIEQSKTANIQLFNDRLGRGVELLANDDMTLRKAGIRVLEDLAARVDVVNQKNIIANILHDFIRQKVIIKYEKDEDGLAIGDPIRPDVDQDEVQLALDVYLSIMYLDEIYEKKQDFSNLDLSYLNFNQFKIPTDHRENKRTLREINFADSIINNCNFRGLRIEGCNFEANRFVSCEFSNTNWKDCNFLEKRPNTELNLMFSNAGSNFVNCVFEYKKIQFLGYRFDLQFIRCRFKSQEIHFSSKTSTFLGGRFDGGGGFRGGVFLKNLNKNSDITIIGTDLSYLDYLKFDEEFEPADIDASKAIFLIDSNILKLLKDSEIRIDERRAYFVDIGDAYFIGTGDAYFIKSDAEWSEKPVDEWIDKEIKESEKDLDKLNARNLFANIMLDKKP